MEIGSSPSTKVKFPPFKVAYAEITLGRYQKLGNRILIFQNINQNEA